MNFSMGYLCGAPVCIAAGLLVVCPAQRGLSQASADGTAHSSLTAPASLAGTGSEQRPETAIRIVDAIDENRLVTLKGNTHPLARAAFDKGPVSPNLPMGDLVLVLSRGAEMQAAFDQFVAGQYDKESPNYHQWLSSDQVGQEFGPAQADIDAISNWLVDHGFTIQEITKDRVAIRFSGSASQVETAFHVEIHNLNVKGEEHIANMSDPQIPAALAPLVLGVKALHNFFPRPLHRLGGQVSLNRETGAWQRVSAAASIPTKRPGLNAPTGVRPEFGTANGYGDPIEDVTPYDFATIYNVLPLWKASTPIDGTGQTIAIAGISNINPTDIANFRSAFGLPAKAPTVVITNSDPGDCPEFNSDCADSLIENTLDVEWSGAVAKGANITLVTSSAPTPTSDPLYLSENYIVQNKTASIMSASYGECELSLGQAGNIQYNNLWETAATEGIAVIVASGDAGSPACDQGLDEVDGVPYAAQFGLAVNGLASTPYDTSVGGTDFNWGSAAAPYWSTTNTTGTDASALGYIPEVAWNQTCANPLVLPGLQADASYVGVAGVVDAESACNFVLESWSVINTDFQVNLAGLVDTIGGGGGVSNCTLSNDGSPLSCNGGYTKPPWQGGVPGIPADGLRDLPDISFFASDGFLGSAYLFCVSGGGNTCSYSTTSEPTAEEIGGTSAGAPAMAGVMALINQKSGSSQGNPNTVLYELAAKQSYSSCSAEKVTTPSSCVFNDVDSGTNAMPCSMETPVECTSIYSGDPLGILNGYSAGTGYDQATGLGSLNVANVVNNWPSAAPFVVLSKTSLTFASTVEGYSSATQAITMQNSGKLALSLNGTGQGISITGTNASSFTQTNTCGTSVAAGVSCTITVTFKPAAIGALTAAVNIADNTFGSPQTVTLSGTGLAPAPTVTLSANSISFSGQWVGASFTAPNMTLTNSGTAALSLSGIGFTGTNASSFSETNSCGASVAVGATCNISITFAPKAAGSLTANLSVADNAPGSPQTVAVSGTGNAVVLSPISLAFPASGTGVAAPAQKITLTNQSSAALSMSGISITGTNASSFTQTNTCGTSVAAAASCVITVTFTPTAQGILTAAVTIADSAYGSPQTVALSGGGTTVTLSPSSIGFVTTPIGVASAARNVTLTNKGSTALSITGFTFTGTDPGSYSQTNTCGTSVSAGGSCVIAVTFKPAASGLQTANLAVADSSYGSPQTVALAGQGTAVSLSPASLTYPATIVGVAAPTQKITLTNKGATAISVAGISIIGADPSSFAQTNTCASSVAASGSCVITVTFTPAASGTLTAAVSIADNAVGSPQTVVLSGTGTTVTVTPASLTYPTTIVGVAAATQQVTLTNKGGVMLSLTGISITGTNASSFSQTNNCGASVAAAASCVITVGFTPSAAGALTAAVSINDNAIGSPQTVALSGSGTAVTLSPSSGIGFVTTPVGGVSPAKNVTLTNKGTTAITVTSVSFTGTDPTSYSQTNTCGTSVSAGASCVIAVTFKPVASGLQTANLSVADSSYGSPQSVALAGQGTAVSLSPASLTFPGTVVGATAPTQQITLTNKGATAISFTGISIAGTGASSFKQTNTCGTSVAAAGSCVITVTFTPEISGAIAAAISIADNAVGSPQTVTLSGAGTTVTLSPTGLSYPTTVVGIAASTQKVTLTNNGSAALSLTGVSITGTNASSFSQTNTCGTSVAAAGSCIITVTFTPAASGALAAAISIADNAPGSPQTVALTGAGTPVSLSSTGVGFVTTPIGTASAARNVTLTNKGTTALSITGLSLTGTDPTSYSQSNTCGTSVAAAGSCVIAATFTPAASGLLTANLSIADDAYGSPQAVALAGEGTAVSLSPTSLTFSSTAVGVAAPTQKITLTNKGATAISFASISITGADPGSFTQTNTCGSGVAASGSCIITVTFTPATSGTLTAAVSIADNAVGSPQTVALTGTGH